MHPLEQIFSQARVSALPLTVIGGWKFGQFGSDPNQPCMSIISPHDGPTYLFNMNTVESPTHLRLILRRINKEYHA